MPPSLPVRLRLAQIRAFSRVFLRLGRLAPARPLLRLLGASPTLERMLAGYRVGFSTREAALAAIARFGPEGHDSAAAIAQHRGFSERARPSDYPALFHLSRLLPTISHVADIGGSVGNVFFCYANYLNFPADFRWTVCEIEAAVRAGTELAAERGDARISFSTSLADSDGADLVLISGALHYLETPPPALFATWQRKPQHVLVNRAPITSAPSLFAVQDSGSWLTAARVINREELVAGMNAAGYELIDEWPAFELALHFPLRPQSSVANYSGMLFSLHGRAGLTADWHV